MVKKCAWCKKQFYATEGWVYRKADYRSDAMLYFCRYHHQLAWERDWEANRHKRNKRTTRCICLDTGEVYPSFSEAARKIGASPESVRNACIKGHMAHGLRFAMLEESG